MIQDQRSLGEGIFPTKYPMRYTFANHLHALTNLSSRISHYGKGGGDVYTGYVVAGFVLWILWKFKNYRLAI